MPQLCQVFIMTAWIKFPQYLDKSYGKLIYKWSGDITKEKLHNSVNHPDPSLPVGCHHCGFHEEESCLQYLFWDFMARWQQHSLMYVPLYLVPRLVMRAKSLIQDPLEFVGGYVHNVLVSGLFLSTYVIAAKSTICISRNFYATSNKLSLAGAVLAAASCGPSVLWERQSRRIELLLYVSQRVREACMLFYSGPVATKSHWRFTHTCGAKLCVLGWGNRVALALRCWARPRHSFPRLIDVFCHMFHVRL